MAEAKKAAPKAAASKDAAPKEKGPKNTPANPKPRGRRKTRIGYVVSDKMQKTIVVELEDRMRHPLYGKIIRTTKKVKAHDENSIAGIGDRPEALPVGGVLGGLVPQHRRAVTMAFEYVMREPVDEVDRISEIDTEWTSHRTGAHELHSGRSILQWVLVPVVDRGAKGCCSCS
jgi:small subunit ribosomal protein S17